MRNESHPGSYRSTTSPSENGVTSSRQGVRFRVPTIPGTKTEPENDMTTCGHCLCGETGWEYDGEATWACFCHCNDCRRNCAAPVVAWIGVPVENFKWTSNAPKTFESSEGVYRHYCEDCGTPMGFEADRYQGRDTPLRSLPAESAGTRTGFPCVLRKQASLAPNERQPCEI